MYNQLITDFSDTLQETSRYTVDGGGCMSSIQDHVVNFDRFKNFVVRELSQRGLAITKSPKSCDALYKNNNNWLLIEFKNGQIDDKKVHEIRGKIFESLLLLTEKLGETITFTRNYMIFVLVYNNQVNHSAKRIKLGDTFRGLSGNKFFPFGLEGLENLYFKKLLVCDIPDFENRFNSHHW
ncbi:MAG: hypothetical protein LBC02_09745 [Planctomycetaceae bacterium]|jgi:hypothetical protein|nr:hypothetical protein [Planctomycetaceae bacterium]